MTDASYVRVLSTAYVLELLGEEVYRWGARTLSSQAMLDQWRFFADTEARMQVLLYEELRRMGGAHHHAHVRMGRWVARWLGCWAGVLNSSFLSRAIQRVLDRRRYSRWALECGSRNPALWQALVDHELKQVAHFEGRGT